jgi:hypothetical protein
VPTNQTTESAAAHTAAKTASPINHFRIHKPLAEGSAAPIVHMARAGADARCVAPAAATFFNFDHILVRSHKP